jgi:hypothetical protein
MLRTGNLKRQAALNNFADASGAEGSYYLGRRFFHEGPPGSIPTEARRSAREAFRAFVRDYRLQHQRRPRVGTFDGPYRRSIEAGSPVFPTVGRGTGSPGTPRSGTPPGRGAPHTSPADTLEAFRQLLLNLALPRGLRTLLPLPSGLPLVPPYVRRLVLPESLERLLQAAKARLRGDADEALTPEKCLYVFCLVFLRRPPPAPSARRHHAREGRGPGHPHLGDRTARTANPGGCGETSDWWPERRWPGRRGPWPSRPPATAGSARPRPSTGADQPP